MQKGEQWNYEELTRGGVARAMSPTAETQFEGIGWGDLEEGKGHKW